MELTLDRLTREFGPKIAVDRVSARLTPGVYGLLGANGAGKTTLMRMVCGVLRPTSGEVRYDGAPVSRLGDAYRARLGYLPQDFGYYPEFTALDFMEYVASLKGVDRRQARERSLELLDTVGLAGEERRRIRTFSGGMKQRVAIARAYATNPQVLLMDEPFGALDAQTRTQLQQELIETWEKERKTCFFITHDVEEAIILGQRCVIMSARPGRVKDIIDIDIPYPRDQATKMTPRFLELKNEIWSQVYQEYLSVRK